MKLEVRSSFSILQEESSRLVRKYEQSIYSKSRDKLQQSIRVRLREIRRLMTAMKN